MMLKTTRRAAVVITATSDECATAVTALRRSGDLIQSKLDELARINVSSSVADEMSELMKAKTDINTILCAFAEGVEK